MRQIEWRGFSGADRYTFSCASEVMQIRTKLNSEFRRYQIKMLCGVVLFFIGLFGGLIFNGKPLFWIGIPGFVAAFIAIFALQLIALKCPKCSNSLGWLALTPRLRVAEVLQIWRGTISNRLKFCPYYGISLDEEL